MASGNAGFRHMFDPETDSDEKVEYPLANQNIDSKQNCNFQYKTIIPTYKDYCETESK